MKHTFSGKVALALVALLFCVRTAWAQSDRVLSIHCQQSLLTDVLDQLEKKYQLSFSYDYNLIKDRRISADIDRKPLSDALHALLDAHDIGFELMGNRYVVLSYQPAPARPAETLPLIILCGRVLNLENNEPVPGVSIRLQNSRLTAFSDETGAFRLALRQPAHTDTLQVACIGFEPLLVPVNLQTGMPCADYFLRFSPQWMEKVVIRDMAPEIMRFDSTGNFALLRPDQVPTLPGWGEPGVLRMLQFMPGVNSADETASNLNVRGGTPDQNLLLWDDIPVYHAGHFFGIYDVFNPYVVQEVGFYGGNFSAAYGGRTASVIDVSSRPKFNDGKWHGNAGFNMVHAHANLEAPLYKDKLRLLVAGRRSYADWVQSPVYQALFNQIFQNGRVALEKENQLDNSGNVRWNPVFLYADLNTKLLWTPNERHTASFSYYRSNDRLDYLYQFQDAFSFWQSTDKLYTRNNGMSVMYKGLWSDRWTADYSASLSRFSNTYDFYAGWSPQAPVAFQRFQENGLRDVTLRLNNSVSLHQRARVQFGYQLSDYSHRYISGDSNIIFQVLEGLYTDSMRSSLHTVFGESHLKVGKRWLFQLGFRENYYSAHNRLYFEPRLFAQYRPKEHSRLKYQASFGRYFQFLFQRLEPNKVGVDANSWSVSGPQLPAQETWQGTAGILYEHKTTLLRVEAYVKRSLHLTSLNLKLKPELENPYTYEGNSRVYGFDVMASQRWKSYSIWATYNWGRVMQQFPGLNLDAPFPARHDVRHVLNVVNMYSNPKFEVSFNIVFKTGLPYAAPDTIYRIDCPECVDGYTERLGYVRLNTQRLPHVFRFDFALNWRVFRPKWGEAKLGVAVYNLLNRVNLLDRDYILTLPPSSEPQNGQIGVVNRRSGGLTPNLVAQFKF